MEFLRWNRPPVGFSCNLTWDSSCYFNWNNEITLLFADRRKIGYKKNYFHHFSLTLNVYTYSTVRTTRNSKLNWFCESKIEILFGIWHNLEEGTEIEPSASRHPLALGWSACWYISVYFHSTLNKMCCKFHELSCPNNNIVPKILLTEF